MDKIKHKPLHRYKLTDLTQKSFDALIHKFSQNPNVRLEGYYEDLVNLLQTLPLVKGKILLSAMDNVVISKNGFVVLIIEIEKAASDEVYDRSLLVDIDTFRSEFSTKKTSVTLFVMVAVYLISNTSCVQKLIWGRD